VKKKADIAEKEATIKAAEEKAATAAKPAPTPKKVDPVVSKASGLGVVVKGSTSGGKVMPAETIGNLDFLKKYE